jgi:hypothetical protein
LIVYCRDRTGACRIPGEKKTQGGAIFEKAGFSRDDKLFSTLYGTLRLKTTTWDPSLYQNQAFSHYPELAQAAQVARGVPSFQVFRFQRAAGVERPSFGVSFRGIRRTGY